MVFQYTATRGGKDVAEFLKDYRGRYLQADAYAVYDALYRDPQRGLREVGCLAHCRRYWMKALETAQDQVGPVLHLIIGSIVSKPKRGSSMPRSASRCGRSVRGRCSRNCVLTWTT